MHARLWPQLEKLRSPSHGRDRSKWFSWLNLKEAADWMSLPTGAFMRLVNKGLLPAPTLDPWNRRVWWPADLRKAAQNLPLRLTPFGRARGNGDLT